MNIFEALEKGNGKATIGNLNFSYVYYENGRFAWHSFSNPNYLTSLPNYLTSLSDLRRNDWIPYVPRGTCSNCGVPSIFGSGRMVKLTPDNKCVECGRGDIFEVVPPSLKIKHKEVFESVKWYRTQWNIIYPAPIAINQEDSNKKLLNKPPMKMTLEWEE